MTIRPSWRSSALVPLALLSLLLAAYPWAYRSLPPRHFVKPHWGGSGMNWFGQGNAASFGFATGILAILFTLRYWAISRSASPAAALAWYSLLLASVLPGVWLLVAFDWDNQGVSPASIWVGDPVALLAVPTAFMCYDAATGCRLPPGWYVARCLLEGVLVPFWAIGWVFFEAFGLGWVGP